MSVTVIDVMVIAVAYLQFVFYFYLLTCRFHDGFMSTARKLTDTPPVLNLSGRNARSISTCRRLSNFRT
jgi:hypothetical protein